MPLPSSLKSGFYKNLLTGAGYFIAGWIGTGLATPPSNISPIWPAAGVALAAMLTYGEAVLPGLFLGAIATQFYAFLDLSGFDKILVSLSLGCLAGFGSCLQAWAGMRLINHWVGRRDALVDDWKVLRFFVLIAVSCSVSPSVGVASLYSLGVIGVQDCASSWAIWWIGDSIGGAIFTPLVLLFIGQPEMVWQSRRRYVLYPLLFVLILVVSAFLFSQRQEEQRLQGLFHRQVALLHTMLEQRLEQHLTNSAALKAFFDSSANVDESEFNHFALSILKPHGETLEWTPRVIETGRQQWQDQYQAIIRQRTDDGNLVPAKLQTEYFPVSFIVPKQGNEQVLGFDISSNPQVAPIISQVIARGVTLATGAMKLVQDDEPHVGTVLYSPVYRKDQPLITDEERREQFLGFVANVFRIDVDIELILKALGEKELQLWLGIYDDKQLIYNNMPENHHHDSQHSKLHQFMNIDFAGRHWRLHYLASDAFFHAQLSSISWWLLLGGFLICGLTSFGLLLLTGRTIKVEELVEQRTRDLSRINQALNLEIAIRNQHENELRIAAATFESHEAILVTDSNGIILRVNEAFTDITGFSADEVVGQNPKILASGHHDRQFFRQMYRHLLKKNQWKGEIWNRRKNGEAFPELLTITGVRNEQKQLSHYVAIFADVSAQKAAEHEIHNLAFYDPLTNLPNRRLMLDRLQHEIAAAKRQGSYGALFFLDLDHFKNLNDSRGHQVGDELLIQVAQRLSSIIRNEDTACRLGGDEFVVMVPGRFPDLQQASDHAALLAEKIRLTINQPYRVQDGEHHFSTSIGVAVYPESADQPEVIIQQADTAMYRAKESGRNGICFFHHSMQKSADRRLTLEKDMRLALQDHQFALHYQPQVNERLEVISAEALIRWRHPTKGMISPAEFIPLAEDTQLILPIGAWVLNEACRQIKAWDDDGKVIGHVAVNVSSRQFRQPGFVQQVGQALLENGIGADRLVVELTEGCVVDDIEDTIAKMRALQTMGIKISIDDFGTGYSSLSYLKSLPLSQLKIDQSFVAHSDDPNVAVIVETIIMMAKSLGLDVIAEGVENQTQMDFLIGKGCCLFQGYYFSRPVLADGFEFKL